MEPTRSQPFGAPVHDTLTWIDVDGRPWHIEPTPQHLIARSGDRVIDLPQAAWARDIYVAEHGNGYIIRFETFECVVRFMVSREAAAPVLAHLHPPVIVEARPGNVVTEPPGDSLRPLLWPKVSPLAVWALILSALVFMPVLGLLPAIGTVILLMLHRVRVRRTTAWRHSRRLCTAACILLVAGLVVSALSTWGLWAHSEGITTDSIFHSTASRRTDWGVVAAGVFVVLLSLTVHEAAHATTAWWLGDGLARSLGRVTLNPLAHIDPIGTVLLPILLTWAGAPVFGYARPVPVRVDSLPRHRRAHMLISIAGPGSNLLLASVSLMALLTLGCLLRIAVPEAEVRNFAAFDFAAPIEASGFVLAPAFGPLCTILKLSFFINTFLAVFNLIPIPPLDGSWVLEHLFPRSIGRFVAWIRPFGFLIILLVIYKGVFEYLVLPAAMILFPGLLILAGATGY